MEKNQECFLAPLATAPVEKESVSAASITYPELINLIEEKNCESETAQNEYQDLIKDVKMVDCKTVFDSVLAESDSGFQKAFRLTKRNAEKYYTIVNRITTKCSRLIGTIDMINDGGLKLINQASGQVDTNETKSKCSCGGIIASSLSAVLVVCLAVVTAVCGRGVEIISSNSTALTVGMAPEEYTGGAPVEKMSMFSLIVIWILLSLAGVAFILGIYFSCVSKTMFVTKKERYQRSIQLCNNNNKLLRELKIKVNDLKNKSENIQTQLESIKNYEGEICYGFEVDKLGKNVIGFQEYAEKSCP